MESLNNNQIILLANVANSIEVLLQHPLFVLKNHRQLNKPIYLKNIYNGFFFNLYSLNLVTSYQYITYNVIYKKTKNDFLSSTLSGLSSGFICSPFEYLSINKKYNESLITTIINRQLNRYIYSGIYCTIIRESIYTCGMLSLTPYIEKKTNNRFISPILSGLICNFFSQPFDTLKTVQQKNKNNKFQNVNFFKGFTYRSIRLINTYFIINEVNKIMLKYFF